MRLLVQCAKNGDGTSFYRGLGPLAALRKRHLKLDLHVPWEAQYAWTANQLRLYDMIFFQRPHLPEHLAMMKCAKDLGIPIWVDHDDFVLGIHAGHPSKLFWDDPSVQMQFTEMLSLADVLTVTTENLAGEYSKYISSDCKLVVIPNALDDDLLLKRRTVPPRRGPVPTILWRGSPIHDPDLLGLETVLPKIAEKFPTWKWVFLGHNPFFLTARMPPSSWLSMGWQEGYSQFMATFNRIQPKIVFAPLADNTFNRCKSNIAWIEGTFANATALCRGGEGFKEWEKPGVVTYSSPEEFPDALIKLIESAPEEQNSWCGESWDYIEKNLLLSHVNEKRAEILGV